MIDGLKRDFNFRNYCEFEDWFSRMMKAEGPGSSKTYMYAREERICKLGTKDAFLQLISPGDNIRFMCGGATKRKEATKIKNTKYFDRESKSNK